MMGIEANGNMLDLEGNGNRTRAIGEHRQEDSGPNGPKLSDGGRKSMKELGTDAAPAVRWSALLGAWNSGRPERGQTAHRRGNDGRCRREGLNGGIDLPGRETCRHWIERGQTCHRSGNGPRMGTLVPSKNPTRETQGLTNSSSAIEHWRRKDSTTEKADRQPGCSLERVVRPPPTEGPLIAGR